MYSKNIISIDLFTIWYQQYNNIYKQVYTIHVLSNTRIKSELHNEYTFLRNIESMKVFDVNLTKTPKCTLFYL